MSAGDLAAMHAYYGRGEEAGRLDSLLGSIEFERTTEIVQRVLPAAPAVVADIGGGPGRYSNWLADLGHQVEHRDIVPAHVEFVRTRGRAAVHSAVGDARDLDLAADSVDAVLLLGPLYHLVERRDRVAALVEARRVVRPGGPVVAAAISRWAPRLHGIVVQELWQLYSHARDLVAAGETDGVLAPMHDKAFCGYTHRPDELALEVEDAGLVVEDLVGVEGIAFALDDERHRLADRRVRSVALEAARRLERVPELLGLSPHFAVTARRPAADH